MRLFGLSDLHVNHAPNRSTLTELEQHPQDWLILAGDLGETEAHLKWTLELLVPRWKQILWVPGNHELWTPPREADAGGLRGEYRYLSQVEMCRSYGVLTPEDPYPLWPGSTDPIYLCPLFLLYDYSYAPDGMTPTQVVAWAREDGIVAMDERLLHADPYPSRASWCAARVAHTAERLAALPENARTVLINHWPLRQDLVRLFRIPRYTPWCGTRLTHDWHTRFRAEVVVSGHLHMRSTDWRDGTRFEEVSLGYPRHWRPETGASGYIRQILPYTGDVPENGADGPNWHR
jgi:hypothetical protein